ncbi:MAG: DUF1311 domain-containing protein [Motiliproteus sp.]|nr:DUF1311 domain-containing protein [Motiliproteus sp.]MCW9053430.1 DUF1311 domain-containing protein [Motiliproteus sp.]
MRWILTIALCCSFSEAFASSEACYDSAVSQAQLNRCAQLSRQEAKTEMEQVLSELQSTLTQDLQYKLLEGQTAWQQMTDSNCAIEYGYMHRGSARSMILSLCYARHIEQRTRTLRGLMCHPMKEECPPDNSRQSQ